MEWEALGRSGHYRRQAWLFSLVDVVDRDGCTVVNCHAILMIAASAIGSAMTRICVSLPMPVIGLAPCHSPMLQAWRSLGLVEGKVVKLAAVPGDDRLF